MNERELALELRVQQLEGAFKRIQKEVPLPAILTNDANRQTTWNFIWQIATQALQAPTPDPSPVVKVLRAAVEWAIVSKVNYDSQHLRRIAYEKTNSELEKAVEALPADVREWLRGEA